MITKEAITPKKCGWKLCNKTVSERWESGRLKSKKEYDESVFCSRPCYGRHKSEMWFDKRPQVRVKNKPTAASLWLYGGKK